jgi:hypothetical protein
MADEIVEAALEASTDVCDGDRMPAFEDALTYAPDRHRGRWEPQVEELFVA